MPAFLRALFQTRQFSGHRPGVAQEPVRLREVEVVDDIDEEERNLGLVRERSRGGLNFWSGMDNGIEPAARPSWKSLISASSFLTDFLPPFFPPFRDGALLLFFPRPEPLFLPPLSDLFTVAQARFSASFLPTPRFSYPSSMCSAFRFCFDV